MKVSVTYGRKIQPKTKVSPGYDFESEELQITVSDEWVTPQTTDPDQLKLDYEAAEQSAHALQVIAKAKVFEALKIAYHYDEASGLPVEDEVTVAQVGAAFGAAVEPAPAAPVPTPQPQYQPPAPQQYPPQAPAPQYQVPPPPGYVPQPQQYPQPQAAAPAPMGPAACPRCGGPVWDNRAENARNRAEGFAIGPDYKCKNRNCRDDKGRQTTVWPQDSYTWNQSHQARPR